MTTYTLECPGCGTNFTHQADPEVLAAGDFDLPICLACGEEWEAEYDPETDELTLLDDDEDDGEEEDALIIDVEGEEEEEGDA